MKYNSLQDMFADQLADVWSAEQQLVDALPKVVDAAASDKLRSAIEHHLAETRDHVARLEWIIDSLGLEYPNEDCEAMQGLVRDGERVMSAGGDPVTRDVALVALAQRIDHDEIAAYGTASALADELGLGQISDVLRQTLNEESNADQTLTKVASGGFMRQGLSEQAPHSTASACASAAVAAAAGLLGRHGTSTGGVPCPSKGRRRRRCPDPRPCGRHTHNHDVFSASGSGEPLARGDDRWVYPGRRHDWASGAGRPRCLRRRPVHDCCPRGSS